MSGAGDARDYPGRATFFVIVSCILAASGGLIFGYDIGISGNLCIPPPTCTDSVSMHCSDTQIDHSFLHLRVSVSVCLLYFLPSYKSDCIFWFLLVLSDHRRCDRNG